MGERCFHCGEAVPNGFDLRITVDGVEQPMCCHGCAAVAELIRGAGLESFYAARSALAPRPEAKGRRWWAAFDRPAMLATVSESLDDKTRRIDLLLDGVSCAACAWLIESALDGEPGIRGVSVNAVSGAAELVWDQSSAPLSGVLDRLDRMGYTPAPRTGAESSVRRNARRASLRRLAVAGIGMMQVMMYAIGLYFGAIQDMETATRDFLRWVSLIVATPVVVYSGAPFFAAAWQSVRSARPGMDVPIALAVGIAFVASLWHTFAGGGEVYLDSAVMFVFFMTLSRHITLMTRHRALDASERFAAALPEVCERVTTNGSELVSNAELEVGDRVRVAVGAVVPADGRVSDGHVAVDESLITGESHSVPRRAGEQVLAGSVVVEGPLELEVERVGAETTLSGIVRLMRRAESQRPPQVAIADRVARYFVTGILLVAGATLLSWWHLGAPERALSAALAVLVVTCPCALSLAVPTAISAARARLTRDGVLLTDAGTLERLPEIDTVAFDKTGTLTAGGCRRDRVTVEPGYAEAECLNICAALEAASDHPLAAAFADVTAQAQAQHVSEHAGGGIEGSVAGTRYRLGSPRFALGRESAGLGADSTMVLAADGKPLCWISVLDPPRPEAAQVVAALERPTTILSGDSAARVRAVAAAVGIPDWHARLRPEDKIEWVNAQQRAGSRVAAVGDGVNDAPLLAGADVGIAVGAAGTLARTRAHVIVNGDSLEPLALLWRVAEATRRVGRRNLSWALGYNLLAVPFAALGLVPPWLAALGMSASSTLVVLHSLVLLRTADDGAPARSDAAVVEGVPA